MSEEKTEVVRTVANVSARPAAAAPTNPEQLKKLTASLEEKRRMLQAILALAERSLRIMGSQPVGTPPDISSLRVFESIESIKKHALRGLK